MMKKIPSGWTRGNIKPTEMMFYERLPLKSKKIKTAFWDGTKWLTNSGRESKFTDLFWRIPPNKKSEDV